MISPFIPHLHKQCRAGELDASQQKDRGQTGQRNHPKILWNEHNAGEEQDAMHDR